MTRAQEQAIIDKAAADFPLPDLPIKPDRMAAVAAEQERVAAEQAEIKRRQRAGRQRQRSPDFEGRIAALEQRLAVIENAVTSLPEAVGGAIGQAATKWINPLEDKLATVERALDRLQSLSPHDGRSASDYINVN
jgi:hypothetical protein